MSLGYFPVAYYDEHGIWGNFSPQITSRLPILGQNLNLPEGEILIPPLSVKFLSHTESFWHENPEYTYKKPYLWIFVLKFTNLEIFKRDIKTKIKELVNAMENKNIEWLILFIPSFTRLVKSDHKSFASSYSKVSNEIQSLLGKSNITRFYCNSNKTFVDLSQPSCIKDEYWAEFLKAVGNGVSIGIQTAICTHLKDSCIHIDSNFSLYSLNLYALSLIYSAIGVRSQACTYLEMILDKVKNSKLVVANEEDLEINLQLSIENSSDFLNTDKISKVYFIRFLINNIQTFYIQEKLYDKAALATIKSLEYLWELFKSNDVNGSFIFIYKFSDYCAEVLISKVNEITKENRSLLYYTIANILIIKMCAMQINFCSVHRNAESDCLDIQQLNNELLLTCRKIYEYFGYSGYSCKSLFYKYFASSYAIQLGKFELISEILNQYSEWPSIDSINSKLILTHDQSLGNSDKMKMISQLCMHQYLQSPELKVFWDSLIKISDTTSALYSFTEIKAHTLKLSKIDQGCIFSVRFLFICNIPFPFKFQQIIAKYSKDFGSFELTGENIVLNPGKNYIELWGTAWNYGTFRLESVSARINKYHCSFSIFSAYIDVKPCKNFLKSAIYCTKSQKTGSLAILELKIFNIDLHDVYVTVSYPEGVFAQDQIEFLTCSASERSVKKVRWDNKKVNLTDVKSNSYVYLMTELDSCENNEATVKFDIKSNDIETSSDVVIKFSESLSASFEIFGDFAHVKIQNSSQFILQLCEIEQTDINLQLCPEQLPLDLDPGQEYHCILKLLSASAHIIIRYLPSLVSYNKLLSDYISPKISEHSLQIHSN